MTSSNRTSSNWVSPAVLNGLCRTHLIRVYGAIVFITVTLILASGLYFAGTVWQFMILPLIIGLAKLLIAVIDYREVRRIKMRRDWQQRLNVELSRYG